MNGRVFRVNLWLHRWSSLLATPPFLVLCVTGCILIFHHEIDEALGYVPLVAAEAGPSDYASFDRLVDAALAERPERRPLGAFFDPEEHPGLVGVQLAPTEATDFADAEVVWVNGLTAEVIDAPDPGDTPTGFLLTLHANWFLGPIGELVGALIALLVLVSIVSGVIVYAPYAKRIAFGVVRRGRGARLVQLDWHNFIGAVVLGWALVVTVTGLALGFGTLSLKIWQATELSSLAERFDDGGKVNAQAPPTGPQAAYAAATDALPGWKPSFFIYPGTDFSPPSHYLVLLAGDSGVRERLLRVALVNARTGALDETAALPWYLKAVLLSQPLHFGDYGGLPLKLLWVTFALLTLFITGNGAWLWWARRRRRRRSAGTAMTAGARP